MREGSARKGTARSDCLPETGIGGAKRKRSNSRASGEQLGGDSVACQVSLKETRPSQTHSTCGLLATTCLPACSLNLKQAQLLDLKFQQPSYRFGGSLGAALS